jgi:hypothetical protein
MVSLIACRRSSIFVRSSIGRHFSTKVRLDISTVGPARVSSMKFASGHLPDSNPDSIETQATEPITITVLEEEQYDTNEDTPLEPKFPTMTAPRGNDVV